MGTILALQSVNALQAQVLTSQAHMATGKKVASGKDDGAAYIIATNLSKEKADNDTALTGLRRGQSLVDVASAAAQSIEDTLQQMKAKALSLTDTSLDTAAKTALQADLGALAKSIDDTVKQASFNGINLLASSNQPSQSLGTPLGALTHSGTASVSVGRNGGLLDLQLHVANATSQNVNIDWGDGSSYSTASNTLGSPQSYSTDITHTYDGALQSRTATLNISMGGGAGSGFQVPAATFTPNDATAIPIDSVGATLDLAHHDLSVNGLGLAGIDQMTGSDASAAVDAALSSTMQALDYYGDRSSLIDRLVDTNMKRSDALQTSISQMTDADLGTEAATAKALQTRQALAVQALNIGNNQSGLLLRLFAPGDLHADAWPYTASRF